ncbi:acetyl-CoA synthetase [Oligella sp. HMSC05A10]|uniref:AMP-binding protein n=1 Tax=Oligella sp. HMSC05A10 TaxID=1581112 RepID=UPI0008A3DB78|nr:AMP-binding protein [Oligella sp. HMSC05A10]OFS83309.1 acetyl-CoA synthetase [Oligella sp. HMSC05A10]
MTDQYQDLYQSYRWLVPEQFNIADYCCHRWAINPQEVRHQAAIYFEDQVGQLTMYSYRQLSERVNKLANGLVRMGVQPQDRIIISLQHSADSAVAVLAAFTVGAIAVPLTAGLSSYQYAPRVIDSQAKVAIIDKHTLAPFMASLDNHTLVKQIIGVDTEDDRLISLETLLARQPSQFNRINTLADSPAMMVYPQPEPSPEPLDRKIKHEIPFDPNLKATILSHRALIGALPGFVASQNWFPQENDIFWSSYDWNSGLGLINALLPALYFGHSIVGCPSGRTIPRLFTLLEHYQVTNILTTAEELERIRDYDETLPAFDLAIRCIAIPDHEKTTSLNAWVKRRFNATLNGIYSDVAFVYLAGDSAEKWPDRENSMGHIYPGRRFSIIDDEGMRVAVGTKGVLAVAAIDYHGHDDPGLATHYWQQAQIHEIETVDGWYSTGIAAYQDEDGYIFRV